MKSFFVSGAMALLFSTVCFGEVIGQVAESSLRESAVHTNPDPHGRLEELRKCNEGLKVQQFYGYQLPVEKLNTETGGCRRFALCPLGRPRFEK